jgi:hypothetical protein
VFRDEQRTGRAAITTAPHTAAAIATTIGSCPKIHGVSAAMLPLATTRASPRAADGSAAIPQARRAPAPASRLRSWPQGPRATVVLAAPKAAIHVHNHNPTCGRDIRALLRGLSGWSRWPRGARIEPRRRDDVTVAHDAA